MKEKISNAIVGGILAGLMVGIGGSVYLRSVSFFYGRGMGAILFSVALLTICYFGMFLYTGKVGYLGERFTLPDFYTLLCGLVGNYVGATGTGLLLSWALPALKEDAVAAATGKLSYSAGQTLILGFFCGILMYAAVKIFNTHKTPMGILFCIPAFIIAGFEHSIADMFYLAAGGVAFTGKGLLFLLLVVIGNSLGGIFIPLLWKVRDLFSSGSKS